ncbi:MULTISPECIES: ABC transporter ATP-binding protein [unclassified Leeuwenhoekiella]|uniref:ABC transporter ATP-binding protein n=1 Tax=unclassified Leeuwenhoekiella TaxID=2615029 RepID=UPI000C4DE114|nr:MULTISPECIES: ABC transporter ATP-binding protein [unclassified Leeuwenhoekiella]MAW94748.1 ABC transporter ATP-binding protein [Leeuwenhoekiella sp.]MAW95523.1 ABC transporter ATP-binding protein [Leeuwenhoekiella sp.]MBA82171.1 ABC transporter ATP-binding protein [Leeuwenhoekiella sp.]|tara:strand:- start:23617 stop:24405 length:789 start_codon:yes stop_codon:yes gene_type:complete
MRSTHSHSVLSTKNLAVGYGKAEKETVVSNINLNLQAGSFVTMVGINGSGKSTLLRTLAGLQEPLDGNIFLEGKPLENLDTETRSLKISVVLTGQVISKNLTVLELVSLGRQPYTNWLGKLTAEDKAEIQSAITATELENLKHKPCYALSDGQLQRALIARALAQNTEVILLDEPTTHLDLHHKASIFSLLKKIARQQQKTILCTTHDIELVLSLCDEMIVLHNNTTNQNTPEALIEQGIFENLFPGTNVHFDKASRRFLIR